MRFGPIATDTAEGAILAHATPVRTGRIAKGTRLSGADIQALKEVGIAEVAAARLDGDDYGEDEAAALLAKALVSPGIVARPAATGRANLHASGAGVLQVEAAGVHAINAVDPAVTLATLPAFATVQAGQMVATVKIIPFGAPNAALAAAIGAASPAPVLRLAPFRRLRAGLIQTLLPGLPAKVLDKTARVTAARLARSASIVAREERVAHDRAALASALAGMADLDLILIFTASALCDFDDVAPAAIRTAGGEVVRAGMPVDPGNLLVLGRLNGRPVIGAPGCARSPRQNGFDWVLDRIVAGLDLSEADIAAMGVGGLLAEVPSRPLPRELAAEEPAGSSPAVGAVVLAAGRSSRMGGANKLLATFGGKPLVRRTAETAAGSKAVSTVVVTGHQRERVERALSGLDVLAVHNPDYAEGLAGSLKAGVAALPANVDGALVLLADMPAVSTADLDRLIEAFAAAGGNSVVRAAHRGKRGNPVLLPASLFLALAALEGDTGARHLVESGGAPVVDVELGEAAFLDVDTPEAMRRAGGVLQD